MNQYEYKRLQILREFYEMSKGICDPVEYFNRQKDLLDMVIRTILEPLYEYEENQKRECVKLFEEPESLKKIVKQKSKRKKLN